MKLKKILFLFFSVIMVVSCSDNFEESEIAKTEKPKIIVEEETVPQAGKSITLSMRTPITLNPLLNEDVTVDRVLKIIFEPLIYIDENQKPAPNLASDFNFSEDGLYASVKLKDNLLWHDNVPITSSDIVYSIEMIKNAPQNSFYKQCVRNINRCEVVDNKTVNIIYNSSSGGNSYNLDFPIIPKHYYEASEHILEPLGSGPFRFVSFKDSGLISFESSDNYFKEKALIDKINVLITPDVEADKSSFEQGIVDVITSNIVDLGKYRGSKNTNTTVFTTTYYDFIGFNFSNPALKDINIRKAIAHIIPKDEIIESVYLGHAVSTETPVNPDSWIYESGVAVYNFDISEGKKKVEDSHYTLNDEGVLVRDFEGQQLKLDFKILVNTENNERVKIAKILKENLEQIGIKSQIDEVSFEEYEAKISTKNFDIIVGGYNLSIIPDFTFLFHSSQIDKGSNIFSYSNEMMDLKLYKASSSANENKFKDSLIDLQLFMVEELPCISLVFRKSALLTDENIYGEITPAVKNVYRNINQWYIYEPDNKVN